MSSSQPVVSSASCSAIHSAADIARHSRADDCWVIVRGVVYDVTSVLASHPGGPAAILAWAGGDATAPFEDTGHSRRAKEVLASLSVGVVAGGSADPCAVADKECIQEPPQPPWPPPPTAPPALVTSSGTGGWQMMDCPICGPVCGASAEHRADPAVVIIAAQKQGDAAARMGQWSEALLNYHEGIGAIRKSTPTETIGAIRVGASTAQRKLGSLRSALRHADLAVASCGGAAGGHAARGAALEALGLVVDAQAAYATAARLEPLRTAHAEAAARLLPLRHLLADSERGGGDSGGDGGGDGGAAELPGELAASSLRRQEALVGRWRRAVDARGLPAHLLPLPTPARVLGDDSFEKSAFRVRQRRLLALLGVDAAAEAARAAHGGHNACEGVREWLVRKGAELGLDVVGELVDAALEADDDHEAGAGAGSDDADSGASVCDESEGEGEEEEGPMVSEEVSLSGTYGRCLLQLELAPPRQRLTLSLLSLESADLGEARLKYTFAVGLTFAYLLQAESVAAPFLEFAEWRTAERGALVAVEGLPPLPSVERRARAFIDFFVDDGARPPLAPRDMPSASSFDAASAARDAADGGVAGGSAECRELSDR